MEQRNSTWSIYLQQSFSNILQIVQQRPINAFLRVETGKSVSMQLKWSRWKIMRWDVASEDGEKSVDGFQVTFRH